MPSARLRFHEAPLVHKVGPHPSGAATPPEVGCASPQSLPVTAASLGELR